MKAPQLDDLARAGHEFNNCLQKLVYAVEEGNIKLVAQCILDAQNMYKARMPEAAAPVEVAAVPAVRS